MLSCCLVFGVGKNILFKSVLGSKTLCNTIAVMENALVAFWFCAKDGDRLLDWEKNTRKKIRQTRRNFLHASMVKQASLEEG
jgi:hypothetical protein